MRDVHIPTMALCVAPLTLFTAFRYLYEPVVYNASMTCHPDLSMRFSSNFSDDMRFCSESASTCASTAAAVTCVRFCSNFSDDMRFSMYFSDVKRFDSSCSDVCALLQLLQRRHALRQLLQRHALRQQLQRRASAPIATAATTCASTTASASCEVCVYVCVCVNE